MTAVRRAEANCLSILLLRSSGDLSFFDFAMSTIIKWRGGAATAIEEAAQPRPTARVSIEEGIHSCKTTRFPVGGSIWMRAERRYCSSSVPYELCLLRPLYRTPYLVIHSHASRRDPAQQCSTQVKRQAPCASWSILRAEFRSCPWERGSCFTAGDGGQTTSLTLLFSNFWSDPYDPLSLYFYPSLLCRASLGSLSGYFGWFHPFGCVPRILSVTPLSHFPLFLALPLLSPPRAVYPLAQFGEKGPIRTRSRRITALFAGIVGAPFFSSCVNYVPCLNCRMIPSSYTRSLPEPASKVTHLKASTLTYLCRGGTRG